jgi:hypothetical protein
VRPCLKKKKKKTKNKKQTKRPGIFIFTTYPKKMHPKISSITHEYSNMAHIIGEKNLPRDYQAQMIAEQEQRFIRYLSI